MLCGRKVAIRYWRLPHLESLLLLLVLNIIACNKFYQELNVTIFELHNTCNIIQIDSTKIENL